MTFNQLPSDAASNPGMRGDIQTGGASSPPRRSPLSRARTTWWPRFRPSTCSIRRRRSATSMRSPKVGSFSPSYA